MIPAETEKPLDKRKLPNKRKRGKFADIMTAIDIKKIKLESMRSLTTGETQRLRDEFMVEFTYNSNAIEGNTLTLKETAMVLEGMTIDHKPLKDHLEAVGHRDAFFYIEDIAQNKTRLTELLAENEERKKTMHPIERIARFHLELEGIHPFIDGNGRTGRLILNLKVKGRRCFPM